MTHRHDWRAELYIAYTCQACANAKYERNHQRRQQARRWRNLARQWAARYRQHAMGEPER